MLDGEPSDLLINDALAIGRYVDDQIDLAVCRVVYDVWFSGTLTDFVQLR